MASPAGAEAGGFRGRGGLKPSDSFGMVERNGAGRPAVGAGRRDACEKAAVKALVPAVNGLPAECRVELQISSARACWSEFLRLAHREVFGCKRFRRVRKDPSSLKHCGAFAHRPSQFNLA